MTTTSNGNQTEAIPAESSKDNQLSPLPQSSNDPTRLQGTNSIQMLKGSHFSNGSDHLAEFPRVHCYYNEFLIKYCLE